MLNTKPGLLLINLDFKTSPVGQDSKLIEASYPQASNAVLAGIFVLSRAISGILVKRNSELKFTLRNRTYKYTVSKYEQLKL